MVLAALGPRCPAGPSACKVRGSSPRGVVDQAWIKALGGEATATGWKDLPFAAPKGACRGQWQRRGTAGAATSE